MTRWTIKKRRRPEDAPLRFRTVRDAGNRIRAAVATSLLILALSVSGCALTSGSSPIPSQLTIATTSLPQGQLQAGYEASLSASGGKSPYVWSVASGSLPTGLSLTASTGAISGTPQQTGTSTFAVAVRDASSPVESASASITITISGSSSALRISGAALPSGIVQIAYSANLSASGGTSPYGWSIASGQLPAGLSLSATGAITGAPSTVGQSTFVAQVTDSSSPTPQTATQSFSISIGSTPSASGPYTSRTDFALIPLPVPLPSVGGATGAGNCITEPGYNTLICRATDIDTLGAGSIPNNQEFSTCCGGWADINVWNSTSTMFFVSTGGGGLVTMSFNPTTHAVAPLFGQLIPSASGGSWSHSNPQVAYTLENANLDPVIASLTFSSQTTPPQPVAIADLAKVPNCIPALAGVTEWEELDVSRDEQTFIVAASSGIQNSAVDVIVYNRTNGCRWYNTQTGQIGGNWGVSGQATTSDSFTVHSVRISQDGQTAIVSPGTGSSARYFWDIASLTVTAGSSDASDGHFAAGYAGYVNNPNFTADHTWCKYGMSYRAFANLLNPTYVIPTVAECGDTLVSGDDHSSWNNDDTSDLQPFFTSTITVPLGTPITTAWQNEVLGFSVTNPGTVWRFFSTYSTGTSQFFTCQNGIGTVSQDGKWFMFTSDWGNALGLDAAGNKRCDVFVGQLK